MHSLKSNHVCARTNAKRRYTPSFVRLAIQPEGRLWATFSVEMDGQGALRGVLMT